MYEKGATVYVRNLAGVYRVEDSWLVNGTNLRRYLCFGIPETGAMLESTQSYEETMRAAEYEPPKPAPELALVPDTSAEDPDIVAARNASTCRDCGAAWGKHLSSCDLLGPPGPVDITPELTEVSVDGIDVQERELKPPRYRRIPPKSPRSLENIIYVSRMKSVGDRRLVDMQEGMIWEVFVTQEINGWIVWVSIAVEDEEDITTEIQLEEFYSDRGDDGREGAIEHAVLLALGLERSKAGEGIIVFGFHE